MAVTEKEVLYFDFNKKGIVPFVSSINYVSVYKAEIGSFHLLTFIYGRRKEKHREW